MSDSLLGADFQQIYSNPANVFPSPEDWRDCPIYFLMVDRFNNPNKQPVHQPYDDPGYDKYQGGSFDGVRAQLQYIKNLGAGAIWLSPVLKNRLSDPGCYHGYGIHDFLHANPNFATNSANADDELRALVDAAHAIGLYVIFDIVLNHTGDMFAYGGGNATAPFSPNALPISWRDSDAAGTPRADWPIIENIAAPRPADALVWPKELQFNAYFRRQGQMPAPNDDTIGDFDSLKQMMTDNVAVQNALIRSYQYVVARFDADGFRIDTLRYLKNGLPLTFGNAIREYALSIGKKNFFTFGEVWTSNSEVAIANFIGRNSKDGGDLVGVDAALDYPLFNALKWTVKGLSSPTSVINMYNSRKGTEQFIISSHGDATRFFVTFLDNHDVKERLRHWDPTQQPALDDEVTLGLACLASLPGIPCVYYGTEQGLHGFGTDPAVREALWGSPGFNAAATFYKEIAQIMNLRASEAAIRYGRFYPRQLSGDGNSFGFSSFTPGVLAFSRILNDREVITVANFSKAASQSLHVAVDSTLSQAGTALTTLYTNKASTVAAAVTQWLPNAAVTQIDGSISQGLCATQVTLAAAEVQILG
jgi:glycosidase